MSNKEARLNIRTSEDTIADLKTAARLRGLSVSSLVNMLVVKAIREEKTIAPEEFEADESRVTTGNVRIRRGHGDWRKALEQAKGMWKDRNDLPNFEDLRKGWDRDVWND